MPLRFSCSTVLIVAALAAVSAHQPPQAPPTPAPGMPARTPPRAVRPGEDPNKGTSILRGWVTAGDTGNPLRRALIRATAQDGRGGGMAVTDGDGRFEIKDLPAGRYNLNTSKAGYVAMSYGQRRPEQQGTMLDIADGQLVEKIALALPRGGVVTGTVLDEFGEPVAGARVSTHRFRYVSGARRLMASGGGTTDDRGAFRIYGVPPGEYFVSAALQAPQQMMIGTGTMSSGPVDGYAPTYYPGTLDVGEATRLTVKAAEETSNVSFGLISMRLSRLSGRAVTSMGAPVVQGFINLMPVSRLAGGGVITGMTSAQTRADGAFQIAGIVAGTYTLSLRPRGMPSPDAEFASMRVTIGQEDVDNVLVVTSRGGIAYGVVTTDENTPLPARPQQISVFARPAEPDLIVIGGDSKVNDDFTFEISGLSEPRLISASIAESPEWGVKSVLHNGVDVTDTPLDFVPGKAVEGLQIVFTRKRTDISGLITNDRNMPDTDATVIAFSQDSSRWNYLSRFVRTARPSQDGRYSLRGLPPDDYFVIAVKDIEIGQWQDPEFLESVRATARRISLAEGQQTTQDLKAVRP